MEKAGLEVDYQKSTQLDLPAEFQAQLAANPALKKAFAALTPGRQRAYSIFFSAAKQSQTRVARVAKWVPHILSGKGMHD